MENHIDPTLLSSFAALPLISDQLPARIQSMSLSKYRMRCASCKDEIDVRNIRGKVSAPVGRSIVVLAAGYCESCKEMFVSQERIQETGHGLERITLGPKLRE